MNKGSKKYSWQSAQVKRIDAQGSKSQIEYILDDLYCPDYYNQQQREKDALKEFCFFFQPRSIICYAVATDGMLKG